METTITRSEDVRERIEEKYGFVSNLMGEMADQSPAVADAYVALSEALTEVSLSPSEQTEAARMFGATEEEIQEAVHLAKHTVGWSVYLNGIRTDYDQFAEELEQIGEYMQVPA